MAEIQVLLTIEEAAKALRIGRTMMFKLLAEGALPSVYIGRARRISLDAIRSYVKQNESSTTAA
jgi:excisionase family DNA binding protein